MAFKYSKHEMFKFIKVARKMNPDLTIENAYKAYKIIMKGV